MNLYNGEFLKEKSKLDKNIKLLNEIDEIDVINSLKNDTLNKKLIQYQED